jgi:vitamin K-dependent gamma-carboxylase
MVWAVARYFANGWIESQFEHPTYVFPYEGFEWVRPLRAPWMHVLFAVVGASAALVALGLWYRVAIVAFTVGFTWAHLCDKTNYLNHYYLVSLVSFLMWFLPLDGALSMAARRHPERRADGVHPTALALLRFQVGLVYVFAGVAKLQHDWLLRGEPLRTWLSSAGDVPLVAPLLGERSVAIAGSWAAAAFDLSVPFLLRSRWWRPAFVAVVLFHVATAVLFPIGLFPVFMIVFATVLLPEGWPRRLLGKRAPPVPALTPARPLGALAQAACILWAAVQVVAPLRHVALPDDVLWAERGFRFSWRVMLVDKIGVSRFRLRDPGSGTDREVEPRELLTPVQERMMSTQPDMLAQFARHLADREQAVTGRRPEVRVDAFVAMNGRPSRRFVDPEVDVAASDHGVPRGWVLPRSGTD